MRKDNVFSYLRKKLTYNSFFKKYTEDYMLFINKFNLQAPQ